MKKVLYTLMMVVSLFLVTSTRVDASANAGDMMRYYNKNKGTYLFTVNAAEIEKIKNFSYLEPQGAVFTTAKSGTKLYRFYHQKTGRYVFTGKQDEIEKMKKNGWVYEGFAFYSGGNVPITRLYHPSTGQHFYTGNVHEVHAFVRKGWINEGVGFYAAKVSKRDIVEVLSYSKADENGRELKILITVENGIIQEIAQIEGFLLKRPLTTTELNNGARKSFYEWLYAKEHVKKLQSVNGVLVKGNISTHRYQVEEIYNFTKISAKQALASGVDTFQTMEEDVVGDKFVLWINPTHQQIIQAGYTLKK